MANHFLFSIRLSILAKKDMLIDYLKTEGYQNIKEIPGKGICGLSDFIFTTT
jgi:hypothetical protein